MSFIVVKVIDGFNKVIKEYARMLLQHQIYQTKMCYKNIKEQNWLFSYNNKSKSTKTTIKD